MGNELFFLLFTNGSILARAEWDPGPAKSERKPGSGVWHHMDITSHYTRDMHPGAERERMVDWGGGDKLKYHQK